jgi:hypothetical protein
VEEADRINRLGFGIIGIVLISLLLQCLLAVLIFILVPGELWECGNSYLNDREIETAALLVMTIYLIVLTIIARILLKQTTTKWFGIVLLASHVFLMKQFFVSAYKIVNWNYYYEEVSLTAPLAKDGRTIKMARYLLNYHVLDGRTKADVLFCLGKGDNSFTNGGNIHAYNFGVSSSPMIIEFENERVLKYYLECFD